MTNSDTIILAGETEDNTHEWKLQEHDFPGTGVPYSEYDVAWMFGSEAVGLIS